MDTHRNKFVNMQWVAVGESEVVQDETRQIYNHPNSPKSGSLWMRKPISFKTCKITHHPRSKGGHVSIACKAFFYHFNNLKINAVSDVFI